MKMPTFVVVVVVIAGTRAFADTPAYFAYSGRRIELLKPANVQLVSEDVRITPLLGVTAEEDRAEYRCRYVLKNLSTVASSVHAGFRFCNPLHQPPPDDKDEWVFALNFIVRDNHITYHVRHIGPEGHEGRAKCDGILAWEMTLAPHEERSITGYTLEMALSIDAAKSDSTDPDPSTSRFARSWYQVFDGACICEEVAYLTDSGSSWKGPVESASYSVRTGGTDFWMGSRQDWPLATIYPDIDHSPEPHVLKIGLAYLDAPSGRWKYDPENGCYCAKMSKADASIPVVRFPWYVTFLPRDPHQCDVVVRELLGPHPSRAEVLELLEIVEAFYGRPPKTESVRRFVEGQVWYHPRRSWSLADVPYLQRGVIPRLKWIARHRKTRIDGGPRNSILDP